MMRSRSGWRSTHRRCAAVAAALWGSVAAAQGPRPLPRGAPPDFVFSSLRVHVTAHEDLAPDQLRALARPQVVLWLETRSNTLRDSTVETLDRFDSAFVELRDPLSVRDVRILEKVPRVGVWFELLGGGPAPRILAAGPRRLALSFQGVPSEAQWRWLQAQRAELIRWAPVGPIDVLGWARFRALSGRKVVAQRPGEVLATDCASDAREEPSAEIDVATLFALSADAFPCGRAVRVVARPDVDLWVLQALQLRHPGLELVLAVHGEEALARQAAQLLDQLALARR